MMSELANCAKPCQEMEVLILPSCHTDVSGASEMTWNCLDTQWFNESCHCCLRLLLYLYLIITSFFSFFFLGLLCRHGKYISQATCFKMQSFYNHEDIWSQNNLYKSYITSPLAPNSLSEWFSVNWILYHEVICLGLRLNFSSVNLMPWMLVFP